MHDGGSDPERDRRHALKLAAYAGRKGDKAARERDSAIVLASSFGASRRDIADAIGIPHVTVSRIIDRTPSPDAAASQ